MSENLESEQTLPEEQERPKWPPELEHDPEEPDLETKKHIDLHLDPDLQAPS